jgi:4-hydroxy-tetrahydrodipicolinate synthase
MIKMEEPPVGQKISRIRDLAGDEAMKIFGGLGGMFFLEELQRGAVGTMTGFAYPEVLVEIYNRFAAGDHKGAAAVFDRYCPLIRYEFQPKIGLALRKYIYQQRGAIRSNAIRSPGMRIDALTIKELEATVARVGLSTTARGRQAVKA